jgi:aryl-alcohol dehydrogenase-like predicted oxidoreductase
MAPYGENGAREAGIVAGVARRHSMAMATVACAWVAGRPGISAPTVGISRTGQFDAAVAALSLELDTENLAAPEAGYLTRTTAGQV